MCALCLRNDSELKSRDSSFELMKIIAMFLIVISNFAYFGNGLGVKGALTTKIYAAIYPVGKIGYVLLICVLMWLLIDNKISSKKLILFYFECVFFAFILGLISTLTKVAPVAKKYWVLMFIPVFGTPQSFLAPLFAFMLFLPFLKKLVVTLTKKQHIYLLVALFCTQVLSLIIVYIFNLNILFFSSILFFTFMYCLMYCLKKHPLKICDNKLILLAAIAICYAISCCYNLGYVTTKIEFVDKLIVSLLSGYTSLSALIPGLACFYLFKGKRVYHSTIINTLSSTIFGILLIQDNAYFKAFFWKKIINIENFKNYGVKIIPVMIAITIAIYLALTIIDLLRKHLLENNIAKIKGLDKLANKIDNIFA